MENTRAYKLFVIVFFSIVGVMFTASLAYLATGRVAPDTFFGRKMTLPKSTAPDVGLATDRHVLERDKTVTIGNRIFVYKGRQGDQIHLDIIIPEIDRQFPYTFKIDIEKSKKGFEVAGIWLQLLTVRSNFVSLKKMT